MSRPAHRRPGEGHGARGRLIEAGGQSQRGGLAAARRADDADELPAPHLDSQLFDNGLAAEIERHIRELHQHVLAFRHARSAGCQAIQGLIQGLFQSWFPSSSGGGGSVGLSVPGYWFMGITCEFSIDTHRLRVSFQQSRVVLRRSLKLRRLKSS
jgi:hypothetical protein